MCVCQALTWQSVWAILYSCTLRVETIRSPSADPQCAASGESHKSTTWLSLFATPRHYYLHEYFIIFISLANRPCATRISVRSNIEENSCLLPGLRSSYADKSTTRWRPMFLFFHMDTPVIEYDNPHPFPFPTSERTLIWHTTFFYVITPLSYSIPNMAPLLYPVALHAVSWDLGEVYRWCTSNLIYNILRMGWNCRQAGPTRPVRLRTPPDPTRLYPRFFLNLLIRPAGRVVNREKPSKFSAAHVPSETCTILLM